MMNPHIVEARHACIDLCDAIESHSEAMTEPSPLADPADALSLAWKLIKTARLILDGTPHCERRDDVIAAVNRLAADLKATPNPNP